MQLAKDPLVNTRMYPIDTQANDHKNQIAMSKRL